MSEKNFKIILIKEELHFIDYKCSFKTNLEFFYLKCTHLKFYILNK